MRRLLLAVAAVALVFAAPATSASTATVTVLIKRTGFSPATVTIDVNDAVTWKNSDTIDHQVVANGGQFASPILKAGKTFTFTFRRAGTYRYHDALHSSLKGTVVVKGPPPSLTLGASVPIVTFGAQISLGGAVSSKKAGETVTLTAQPIDQGSPQVIATLQTTANGAFSFNVTPLIFTTYVAQWKSAASGPVVVQIAPRVRLPAPTRGWFHTFVTANKSFAGHFVYLQRLSGFGQWVSIKKLILGSKSGRIFRASAYLPRGRSTIRIFITVNQAGLGYLAAHSGTQRILKR